MATPPFKTLLGFATVKDQTGRDMHKSDGNSIEFVAAADTGFTLTTKLKPKEAAKLPDGATAFAEIPLARWHEAPSRPTTRPSGRT